MVKSVFYMEKDRQSRRRHILFWRITVDGNQTIVRAGKINHPGREFPPRQHQGKKEALLFAKCQAKRMKTKHKYVSMTKERIGEEKESETSSEISSNAGATTPPICPIQKPILKKFQSFTVGQGNIYVPPRDKWPVIITAPVFFEGTSNEKSKDAYGIYVDDKRCFIGDESGLVIELDESKVKRQYKIPTGVKCIVRDGEFMYVGSNGGGIYDLTHGEPRLMCQLEQAKEILWLDIHHGRIGAGGVDGKAALINCDGEIIWKKGGFGAESFMIRVDDTGLYNGNSRRTVKHALKDGSEIWCHRYEKYDCNFGVQSKDMIYLGMKGSVRKYDKHTGTLVNEYKLQERDYRYMNYHYLQCPEVLYCNEVADGLIITGGRTYDVNDPSHPGFIKIIDEKTKELVYIMKCHIAPLSMQCHKGRIYIVGRHGKFACLDLCPRIIKKAIGGWAIPESVKLQIDQKYPRLSPLKRVESVRSQNAGDGVLVHCVREGAKIKVKPLTDGYNKDWIVQFPLDIRRGGVKFIVDELKESLAGGFYRAYGNIREIED